MGRAAAAEEIIRKNVNIASVFLRAARNQRWKGDPSAALANALLACEEALALLPHLPEAQQEALGQELQELKATITRGMEQSAEERADTPETPRTVPTSG